MKKLDKLERAMAIDRARMQVAAGHNIIEQSNWIIEKSRALKESARVLTQQSKILRASLNKNT